MTKVRKPSEEAAPAGSSQSVEAASQDCFVIMPISDQPNYPTGHFTEVYRDIIKPACLAAGIKPRRADESNGTNIIQHEILLELLNTPLAICDLSSRNPNVMFELGLRQAFDKPVVIIQDELTPPIFDISMLRYTTYRSRRVYNEVVEDQLKIQKAIKQTLQDAKSGKSTNSLIKLLSINKAILESPSIDDAEKYALRNLQSQMQEISTELRFLRRDAGRLPPGRRISNGELPILSVERLLLPILSNLNINDVDKAIGEINRKVLISRLIDGNTSKNNFESIVSEIGVPPGTCWLNYRQAIQNLHDAYKDREEDDI